MMFALKSVCRPCGNRVEYVQLAPDFATAEAAAQYAASKGYTRTPNSYFFTKKEKNKDKKYELVEYKYQAVSTVYQPKSI